MADPSPKRKRGVSGNATRKDKSPETPRLRLGLGSESGVMKQTQRCVRPQRNERAASKDACAPAEVRGSSGARRCTYRAASRRDVTGSQWLILAPSVSAGTPTMADPSPKRERGVSGNASRKDKSPETPRSRLGLGSESGVMRQTQGCVRPQSNERAASKDACAPAEVRGSSGARRCTYRAASRRDVTGSQSLILAPSVSAGSPGILHVKTNHQKPRAHAWG